MTLKKMIIPVCVILMLVLQLVDYFLSGDFNFFILATACFIAPSAIKDFKPDYVGSSLRNACLFIGLIIMSVGIYVEFIK